MYPTAQAISQLASHLPLSAQAELLDFAQFLSAKYQHIALQSAQSDTRLLDVGTQLAKLGGTEPQLNPIPRRRDDSL
jgi:hypothetical protein